MVPCVLVIQFANIENANLVLNILQFVQLPFVLIPTSKFAAHKRLMKTYALKGAKYWMIAALAAILILLNGYQLVLQFPSSGTGRVVGSCVVGAYFLLLIALMVLKLDIGEELEHVTEKKVDIEMSLLSYKT